VRLRPGAFPAFLSWFVDRDDALTVTLHQLSAETAYAERAKMPLAWLLPTNPGDHLD
jgi:hypothetical protein